MKIFWKKFLRQRSLGPALAAVFSSLLISASQVALAASPDILLLHNDAQEISLRYRTSKVTWQQMEVGEYVYSTPVVEGCGMAWPEGAPQLPTRVIWLAIPPGATAAINSVTPYAGMPVNNAPAPVPLTVPQEGGFESSVYQEDPAFYAAAAPFPAAWIEMQGPEAYRDLQVVRLLIFPFRFPSTTGGILSIDSLDVTLRIQGGTTGAKSFVRPIEDQFFQGLISNWQGSTKSWKMPRLPQSNLTDPWPAGDLYKIEIGNSGIYKLTYNDLVNAGIDLSGLDPRTIRLFNNGGRVLPEDLQILRAQAPMENAILIQGEEDGSFDPGDEIWFYGQSVNEWEWNSIKSRFQHYRNPYTDHDVYWLNINPIGPPGKRMTNLGQNGTAVLSPLTTRGYYYDEKELYVVYDDYNLPQSMPDFYGDSFSGPSNRSLSFYLENVVDSAPAFLTMKIRYAVSNTHVFEVYINNVYVFTTSSPTVERSLDPGLLHTGNNSIRLEHQSSGTAYLDYFEIEYTRNLTTSSGQLMFISPEATGLANFQVTGISSPWIFDITDYADVRAVEAASFKDSSNVYNPRRYLAVNSSALLSPLSLIKDSRSSDEYSNLRSTLGADVLVLCADDFYAAMEEYETYREASEPSLQVLRIKISDIFNEYGWGLVDPAAIRDFLKATLPIYNWSVSPIYVLFVGDGDFDYKNKLSTGDENWLIPFVSGSRCTDDWYSYFTPTDNSYSYPQLATGRWPARSVAEVEELISRLQTYESATEFGPWQNMVTFVADDEYGQGGAYSSWEKSHTEDTEYIAENYVPQVLNVDKIYLTEYPVSWDPAGGGRRKPEANADLIEAINEGRLLINYMGHGNPTVWAHEHAFLQSRDLPLLNNGGKLPLFVAATCDWAYWDSPFDQSMPEVMLTLPGGGAISTVAATRVTGAGSNSQLAQSFYQELFAEPGSTRVGLALMRAKSNFFVHYQGLGSNNTNNEKYHLLGDPLMRLAMPQLLVQFDSSSADTLNALDHVTLSGQVLTQGGTPLANFAGTAQIQVFDTRIPVYYGFNNSAPPSTPTYILPGNLIFRGDCTVLNGHFQSTFIVPVDINYGGAGGRFSVLAYSEDQAGAGADDEVVLGQSAATVLDSLPPSISVYFDSPGFRPGDPVSPTATLNVQVSDSNGINLTGSVGHGIIVTIDDLNPLDLTEAFTYDLDSYTTGKAEYQFLPGELSAGTHELQAMAWDAANNPSISSVDFVVVGDEELRLTNVLNYPNPFSGTTRFTFSLTETAEVTIKIYTVAGRLVKAISGIQGNASFNYDDPALVWDGRDAQGDLVSNGVYIYKVLARGLNGKEAEEIGKLMFIR